MENYTQTCRFILSCNFSSKILDPIQSRCAVFKFKPLEKEDIISIIDIISKEEGLSLDIEAKDALFFVSDGDCRRVENILQSSAAISKTVTKQQIFSLASVAEPKDVKEALDMALKNNFTDARKKLLDIMLNYGLSGLDIIKQIQKEVWNLDIDSRRKVELIDRCGEIEFRMVEGSDEYIQLEALLAHFTLAGG